MEALHQVPYIAEILTVIGGSAVISRALYEIAKRTPWDWDDKLFGKCYGFLQKVADFVALKPKQ